MATERLYLRLDAPFAACRPFVAGWYRPTAPFLTHSAAYGLLLNVAGVESRLGEHEAAHDGRVPTTLTRSGLPALLLALGIPAGAAEPRVASVYQQLHNYPVGTSGMDPALSMGTKNNITPVRRELLCDVRAIIAVECDPDFAVRLRLGLNGHPTSRAYGLPFVGDNSFLPDRFEETPAASARWYERVDPADRPQPGTARLTLRVDRAVMSNTTSALFAPATQAMAEPSGSAWATVGG